MRKHGPEIKARKAAEAEIVEQNTGWEGKVIRPDQNDRFKEKPPVFNESSVEDIRTEYYSGTPEPERDVWTDGSPEILKAEVNDRNEIARQRKKIYDEMDRVRKEGNRSA
jgi:hypothetical protein